MSDQKQPLAKWLIAVVALIVVCGGVAAYFINMKKDALAVTAGSSAPAATQEASMTPSSGNNTGEPAITPEEEKATTEAATAGFNGVDIKPGNPVVAKVDGQDITRVDVFRYIKMMPANVQQLPPQAVYPLALEQVVNTRLVQNKAEDANLATDPEVLQQESMARQQIIRSVYVQRALDKEISDSDLKKKYDDTVGKTPAVSEVKAAHILVESEAKAKELITKLEGGADFAKLAAENSGDPGNKDKGGDLGWFAKTDMVPEFAEAAFKLGKGDVSKTPVKTQFGYHVIKVEDKRDRPKPGFDEVKPMLLSELRREKLEGMLEGWRKNAKIEKFDINGNPVKEEADVAPAAGAESTPAPAKSE